VTVAPATRPQQTRRGPRVPLSSLVGLRVAAGTVTAVGGLLLWQSMQIRTPAGYSVVGPAFFPIAVSVALIGLGLWFVVRTTVLLDTELAEQAAKEDVATHWSGTGLLLGVLLAYAFVLEPFGYVLATLIFLPAAARILGSRALIRDVAVAIVVSVSMYFAFTRPLGIRLPGGVLGPVLDRIG
jgi:putative tricarboxylic transport membrane protein